MNILIINCILTTAEKGVIAKRSSIKDTMIYNFAMGFLINGHSVTLVASEEYRPTAKEQYDFDIVFFKSKLPKIFKPDLLPFPVGLTRYLNDNINRFDMVVSSETFSIASLIASGICRNKLVIWQEMAMHQKFMFKLPAKLWYNIITRFFINKQLIIPRSIAAANFIQCYSKNVTKEIVDHGANGSLFVPEDNSEDCFIIVARLVKGKNIDKMIFKFKEFIDKKEYTHYKLHIVGDGEEYDNLKKQIEDFNLTQNVILHGFMPHSMFCSYLRRAKGLLVNTIKDLNMVSIPEAIISGTPVLTNSVPTTASFIKLQNLGIVKDDWGSEELVSMIENYDKFHLSCIEIREELTNVGSVKKMIRIYTDWVNAKK